MNEERNQALLSEAFELIEAEKLDEARTILEPIIDSEPNDADAWWLYAHAITDVQVAQTALTKVLTLNPDDTEAIELLNRLEEKFPALAMDSFAPETLPDLPDTDGDVSAWLDDQAEESTKPTETSRLRNYAVLLLITILLVVVIAIGYISVRNSSSVPSPSATIVAQIESTSSDLATVAPSTPAAIESTASGNVSFDVIRASLATFNVPDNGIETISTELGNTLLVTSCLDNELGPGNLLFSMMDVLAKQNGSFAEDIQAIGIRLTDCEQGSTVRVIGVELSQVIAYDSGDLNEKDFQRSWRPIE